MATYPTTPPGNTLTAIQQKVRRLTRSPSENMLSTDELNNYINTCVLYDFPAHLRTFQLRQPFTFWCNPYQDTYQLDIQSFGGATNAGLNPLYDFQNLYIAIHKPVYVAGYETFYTQDRQEFYANYPINNFIQSIGVTGDGVTKRFAGTIQFGGTLNNQLNFGSPINNQLNNAALTLLKRNVLFDSIDINNNGLSMVDVPVLDATTGVETIFGNLYVAGTQPTTPPAPPEGLGPIQPPLANAPYIPSVIIAPVKAASTVALTVTYANGVAGVGATLTNAGAQAAFAIDGYTANLNDRILIKNQASQFQNGIYSVTTLGSGVTNWVLTRTTDYDQTSEIVVGSATSVLNGTVNVNTSWIQANTVNTIGTDPIFFNPFSGVNINNYINYLTGQFVVTFPVAPRPGVAINSQTVPTIPSRPFAMLYHNNTITLRPVPDQPYAINFEVDARPTQLFQTNSIPQLQELWQYLSYLAAKKIFEDKLDMDSVALILPELDTQERLCLRRTLVTIANQRAATIYAGVTGDNNQFNQGWGYGGTFILALFLIQNILLI